ncbi:Fungalysin metallopeptidase-domain-containing protein [Syncephalis fuscata]|nr:Fungalysin metallopeptidase-domain-containing protein [Syncephalis fuscata]
MHGIEIQSSNMEFHLDDKGQIINYAHSFYSGPAVAKPAVWSPDDPKMIASMRAALQELSNHIKQKLPNINAVKITPQKTSNENDVKYIIENVPFALDPIQQLTLAWEFTIKLKIDYINAHVAVDRPRVVALANWTSRYQYNVVPLGKIRIYESGQTVLTDPQKLFDPKNDWHIGTRKYNALWGNNIQIENDGVTGYVKSKNDIYNYNGYGPASISAKAAATNAFYIFNMMHDIFREYGGYGNDPVQAYLRYPESINNAFFATPPDGQSGILKTGMWTGSYPNLDSGFQSQLMVHEVTHGTSNRLIGGSHNSNCLTNMEGKAMGEGWSDFVALWVEMTEKSQPTDRMDVNKLDNIYSGRPYPYSLSKQDNPARYGNLLESKWQQEHAGGSIWGNILYQIYWNLVRKHGFIDWKNYKYGQHEDLLKQKGNTLALKVIITGMKLTLCSPTFIAARNAILQAEKALTFGNNACEIWAAFAKRGLGLSAQGLYAAPLVKSIEAYDMPKGCEIIQPWMT